MLALRSHPSLFARSESCGSCGNHAKGTSKYCLNTTELASEYGSKNLAAKLRRSNEQCDDTERRWSPFSQWSSQSPPPAYRNGSASRSPSPVAASHQPASFRKRIARYAGKDEHDVMSDDDTFKSSMPFWTAVDAILRFPPKSAAMIRQSLLKIRQTLRS
ncbi:hypothetical protein Pla52n_12500 [Stieleria varia]|uniref:Uncharacterized protein n=1 Tax=Stieleria varia TaxID=2528005 RepID=A0A5C6B2S0_9BACT|nr:hypothetical protein Pla52n_12500 [Stieleria varia]